MTTVRCLQANKTSRHVMIHHVRHIFMPNDQTNPKKFHLMQQFFKCKYSIPFMLQNIQSHSCCNQKRTHWIVATINPIPCRPCVHHGTFPKVLIDNFYSSNCREIIIFAHNFILKTKHKPSNSLS